MNTLLTLLVIYFTKGILGINPWIANAAGYGAGFVNSFVWNKFWVFRSNNGVMREAIRFCLCFAACYLLQLLTVWLINECTPLGDMEFRIWRIAFLRLRTGHSDRHDCLHTCQFHTQQAFHIQNQAASLGVRVIY